MYNWSVDEKQFNRIFDVFEFLKKRPEVMSVRVQDKSTVKVRLIKNIHRAVVFTLAKTLQEKCGRVLLSVAEENRQRKVI